MKPSLQIDHSGPSRVGHHPEQVYGAGFDDDGERVPITVSTDDEPPSDSRRDTLNRLLDFLTGDSLDPLHIGRRLLLLASISGAGVASELTGAELAKLLGVSAGRVSQLRRTLEDDERLNNFRPRKIRGKAAQMRAKSRLQELAGTAEN